MNTELGSPTLYLLAFALPIAYQRMKYWLLPESFVKLDIIRVLTKLDLHHGHWGLLFMVTAGTWNTMYPPHMIINILFYYGLGLVCDEIIPFLRMPTHGREVELRVYESNLFPTLILGAVLMIILSILWQLR